MICMSPAPNDFAASTTPGSTSRRLPSIRRATKGVAAMVRGTIEAVLPMEVPAISLVRGIIAIIRMMNGNERSRLTITFSME